MERLVLLFTLAVEGVVVAFLETVEWGYLFAQSLKVKVESSESDTLSYAFDRIY